MEGIHQEINYKRN